MMAWSMGKFGAVVRDLFDALVNRRLRAYGQAFRDSLEKDIQGAFDGSRDPQTGATWPALKYRQGKPLVLTGRLMRAALDAVRAGQMTRDGYRAVLTDPPYGVFHQLGTRRVPQRRFFAYSPETARAARRAFAAELVSLIVG